jgi:hypothetical protein
VWEVTVSRLSATERRVAVRKLGTCVIVAVAVMLSACATGGGRADTDVQAPTSLSFALTFISTVPRDSPDADVAVIEIHNALDRTVTIVFDGQAQADASAAPRRSSVVRLEPGHYFARGSAPSMASMPPPGYEMNVDRGGKYRFDVTALFTK